MNSIPVRKSSRLRTAALTTFILLILDLFAIEGGFRILDSFGGVAAPIFGGPMTGELYGGGPEKKIVFVGDSTVAGIGVRYDLTLPARFAKLAFNAGVAPLTVWNYARPGTPIPGMVPDALEAFDTISPDILILRGGGVDGLVEDVALYEPTRDFRIVEWTRQLLHLPQTRYPDRLPVGPRAAEFPSLNLDLSARRLWIPTRFEFRSAPVCGEKELAKRLVERMTPIARAARAKNISLVLLDYLHPNVARFATGEGLRRAAAELDIPIIETYVAIEPLMAKYPHIPFFFPDGHPGSLGYGIEARQLLVRLGELFHWKMAPQGDAEDWLQQELKRKRLDMKYLDPPARPSISIFIKNRLPDFIDLEINGAPSCRGWIFIGVRGEPWNYRDFEIPIQAAHVAAAGEMPWTKFTLDHDGRAIVHIPLSLIKQQTSDVFVAAMVSVPNDSSGAIDISDMLNLTNGAIERIRRIVSEDSVDPPLIVPFADAIGRK